MKCLVQILRKDPFKESPYFLKNIESLNLNGKDTL